jgi:hypothetical protein
VADGGIGERQGGDASFEEGVDDEVLRVAIDEEEGLAAEMSEGFWIRNLFVDFEVAREVVGILQFAFLQYIKPLLFILCSENPGLK